MTIVSKKNLLLAPIAAVLIAACGGYGGGADAPPAVDVAAEAETIKELDREWARRFAAGDLDWIEALHSENAVLMAPGAATARGPEAIRASWQYMLETIPETSWEPTMTHVAASGDVAYTYGTATVVTPDGTIPGKYMEAWTKVDGEWKVAADIFNMDVP